jgi:hypothetical protein
MREKKPLLIHMPVETQGIKMSSHDNSLILRPFLSSIAYANLGSCRSVFDLTGDQSRVSKMDVQISHGNCVVFCFLTSAWNSKGWIVQAAAKIAGKNAGSFLG